MSENPNNNDDNLPQAKRLKTEEGVAVAAPRSSVQDVLAKAKGLLAKRQALSGNDTVNLLPVSSVPVVFTIPRVVPEVVPVVVSNSSEKPKSKSVQEALALAKQAKELSAQAQTAQSQSQLHVTRKIIYVESMDDVIVTTYDKDGRPQDAHGNILELVKPKPIAKTVKVTDEQRKKPILPVPKAPQENLHYDPNLAQSSLKPKISLSSSTEGSTNKAQQRKIRNSEVILSKIETSKNTRINKLLNNISHSSNSVEPWDDVLSKLQYGKQYILDHPIQLQTSITDKHVQGLGFLYVPRRIAPVVVESHVKPLKLMLTKQEQKKSSRQHRLEKERVKQDLMRAGAIPTPEPRIKLNNLARVLGSGQVENPTLLQAKATQQMAARVQGHIEHNLANMLTPEEKREKLIQKYKEDTSTGVEVRVYRVGSMGSGLMKSKVKALCQDLYITGMALLTKQGNILIVEGGPKALNRLDGLVTRRIDWKTVDDQVTPEQREEYDGFTTHTDCITVWQGMHPSPKFTSFNIQTAKSPEHARYILELQQIPQYYDSAAHYF